ncbi:MAG: FxLYD domain-containing protein, partial [Chloroflexales bacterium]
FGEVYNPGPDAINSVQLQVTLLDDAGAALVSVSVWIVQELIRPDQTAPFRVLFTDPPAAYSRASVEPLRGEKLPLSVQGPLGRPPSSASKVRRSLRISEPISLPHICVA